MVAIARKRGWLRAIVLCAAIAGMAAGLYGGLLRIGVDLPDAPQLADSHGPLMICGMFGTLITLERAAALGKNWAYLAPVCFCVGGIGIVAGLPGVIPVAFFVAGSLAFVAASVVIFFLQRAIFTAVLGVGALGLFVGNVLLAAGTPVPDLAGLWLVFLVCTIAAERLELSRVLVPSFAAVLAFVAIAAIFVSGAAFGIMDRPSSALAGVGLVGMAAWLARYDVAQRTVRIAGQPRFMALAMLGGYVWLAIAGIFMIAGWAGDFAYDLILHAVFIGFVLSMVFGHALIILPSLVGIRLDYSGWLYLPLALLHASVVLRLGGDLLDQAAARSVSGSLTAVALVAFAATLIVARRWYRAE